MGLKSGSRDAGLDDKEDTDPEEARDTTPTEAATEHEEAEEREIDGSSTDESAQSESTRPTMQSIPYKLRRDRVNEGREQVPFFLRENVIDAEDELQNSLETMLGEDVYKSDYREAAMIVAQRNPELVAEVLREWGYDLDAV